ncbi:hypothetical protein [Pseudomonas sp. BBP2017]|uniref:hypothetical protein n=1 Tax=Pseudomonas sp. BBP2017 TaxID=2109731 RepID=UPI000D1330C8|nr:hypothetical protein [Pseudomonas sp. BBP2017]PSS58715.1 hypothetical protein C6382_05120 [Pseudomonas sp. BBP2017]
MNATSKEKLTAWLKRPRGSFGIVAAVVSFVLLASIATGFEGVAALVTAKPWILLGFVAISLAIGVVVQHRYTLLVGKAIFSPGAKGWRQTMERLSTWAKESNIALCLLIAVGVGYPTTLYFAARSVRTIVAACEVNLSDKLGLPGEGERSIPIASPLCACLSQLFLDRNGVLRLALFNTSVLDVTDFQGITEEDEQQCLNRVIPAGQLPTPQASSSQ